MTNNPFADGLELDFPALPRVADYLFHYASASPTADAVLTESGTISYSAIRSSVEQLAKAFVQFGIGPGDRIAVLAPAGANYFISFLAATAVGAVWMGLNPKYKVPEMNYVVGDAAPRLVLAEQTILGRDYKDDLIEIQEGHSFLEQVFFFGSSEYQAFLDRGSTLGGDTVSSAMGGVQSEDPALLVYTSGTTGKPKGALLNHAGLIRAARVRATAWPARPFRTLNNLPINHIGCVGDITCTTLVSGGAQYFMSKFDPTGTLAAIEHGRLTAWYQVPTMFQLALDSEDADKFDLSSLQAIVWSGARAPRELIARLARLAPGLGNDYSMTESIGAVTLTPLLTDLDILENSVGWPAPARPVRLVAPDTGEDAADGQSGEILLRDDFMMSGYLNRPDATAEAIDQDGWLHTGDLAQRRPDGTIEIVGRLKEMFKSGGYNVYPREVEEVLEGLDGISMAAVVARPDDLYGEVGCAFLLPEPGAKPDVLDLETACRERLANYKVPKEFTVTSNLPMLPIGKIDKQALKAQVAERTQQEATGP